MKKSTTARRPLPVSKTDAAVLRQFIAAVPKAPGEMWLRARARAESDTIATALRDAPVLDRDLMGAAEHPFHEIASAPPVYEVVAKIVRRRLPDSRWPDAHAALIKTNDNGKGYGEFVDAFRDVAFLVGVDYALRSLPSWWRQYRSLGDVGKALLGRMVVDMADAVAAKHAKGGAR